ncbi:MAG TPA: CAP domain-containing protein [Solirubrobacterales bacterium]|nr:CAP domain-containing protein [Solirubrobacterales bacterium]
MITGPLQQVKATVAAAAAGLALVAFLATLAIAAGPAASVAEAACPKASQPATELSREALRKATMCRINDLRRSKGRTPVVRRMPLQRVAQRHTKVMVRTGCLRHRCGGEAPLKRRLRRSGYLDGAKRWRFGQNTGCAMTARVMVRKWRQSRFHRKNMLRAGFEHIGVGAIPRVSHPSCPEGAATFTALLTWRDP